jgi:hypothetical protein
VRGVEELCKRLWCPFRAPPFVSEGDGQDQNHREEQRNEAEQQPAGEPEVRPSGNREFVLRDPDGYKLVFIQKK